MKLDILYEDEHIIVCYKPAGIPTQTKKLGEQDMVSLLKNYLKGGYVAVIHRLDQPVEGLLVFAKTPFAAKQLNKGLQGAGFGKHYKAVLWGVPNQKKATLEDYLVKDGHTNTSRVCEPSEVDAKKAVLSYEVMVTGKDEGKDFSLVKVKLDTGRHHQIRAQLSAIGCVIKGDLKYGAPRSNPDGSISLHSRHVRFTHPVRKEEMEIVAPPFCPIMKSCL